MCGCADQVVEGVDDRASPANLGGLAPSVVTYVDTIARVKVVVQVKLMPQAEQAGALWVTLRTVNEAANWVSEVAFEHGVPREYELRKHTYGELRSRGLGAQAA
ncbi:hypothetical protein ACFTWO_48525, partial [Streptomyces sp. NPDC056938]